MHKESNTYDRIMAYLKGLLSDRQRHELERDIMHDVFEEEAFEGLSGQKADELAADMEMLNHRLAERLKPPKTRYFGTFLRVAAAVTFFLGVGGILYMLLRQPSTGRIAEASPQKAAPAPAAAIKEDSTVEEAGKQPDDMAPATEKGQIFAAIKEANEPAVEGEQFEIALQEVSAPVEQVTPAAAPMPEKSLAKTDTEDIVMQEDILALEEVVVIGYGTQRKSDVTGAVSHLEAKDLTPVRETDAPVLINPVPPGGSLKVFKTWVESRIDRSGFADHKGKYRIPVTLTVDADGSVNDVQVKSAVPEAIADAYIKVIAQSQLWLPATKDSIPVAARVIIRFNLMLE